MVKEILNQPRAGKEPAVPKAASWHQTAALLLLTEAAAHQLGTTWSSLHFSTTHRLYSFLWHRHYRTTLSLILLVDNSVHFQDHHRKAPALPDSEPWQTPDGLEAAKSAPSNSHFHLSALAEGNPISQNQQSCLSTSCSSLPSPVFTPILTRLGRSKLRNGEKFPRLKGNIQHPLLPCAPPRDTLWTHRHVL